MNGETEAVYTDIEKLGDTAFHPSNYPEIEKVLTETFERVAFNLDIIYKELLAINYVFNEGSLVRPHENTDEQLAKLDNAMSPFGFVPQSLKTFYKIVGSCNFAWDYHVNEDFIWNCADPIQILSLDDIVSEVTSDDGILELKEISEYDGFASLQLSADYLHKDNISGGRAYSLKLTDKPSIDGQFLHEEHNTTFINYLRLCFDNCGFPRMTNAENGNDYGEFFDKVQPLLKKI
jgi:hypothetical protein